jgi:hypothetical protein
MRGKLMATIVVAVFGLMAMLLGAGCGGETKVEQPQVPDVPGVNANGDDTLDKRIEELKKLEMTVEIVEDGKSTSKWTQKNGSWRYDDPNDKTSYIIYNNQKQKTWVVSGDQATETSGSSEASYAGFSPAMIMSVYAMMPRTGGTDDTWEYNIPGAGKLSMEMKGPQGLPSKMVVEDAQTGKTNVTEFKYTNVGSVQDSTFELPANVQITPVSGGSTYPGGTSTGMMPSGGY